MLRSISFSAVFFWLLAPCLASADDLPSGCLTEANTVIHVTFKSEDTDPLVLKHKFDADIKSIESLATATGATRIAPGGMNYSVQPQAGSATYGVYDGPVNETDAITPNGGLKAVASTPGYILTGLVNFEMKPSSKGLEVLKALLAKNWPATLDFVEYSPTRGRCTFDVSTGALQ